MAPGAPAQIFVARHGARMDQADNNWHLTSPTPYDPPLTYGGWTQARSLGTRIASLIVKRLQQQHDPPPLANSIESLAPPPQSASTWTPGGALQAKESPKAAPVAVALSPEVTARLCAAKIIIHTSPFLRCVQTSIGVASGISQQFYSSLPPNNVEITAPRPLLRMDAWLGEWLCEDYFTHITPPPTSSLMCGTAKIDLMRPSSAGALRGQIRNLERPIREDSEHHHHHAHSRTHSLGYLPPTPTYAIGKNDPIPRGYVSHAKEHIDIDYAWDSLKFGDGGEYGEEWGMMHKRLRRGFEKTLDDYVSGDAGKKFPSGSSSPLLSRHATSFDQMMMKKAQNDVNGASKDIGNLSLSSSSDKQIDSDTILIFITHGAGCNALIGAMTHQPVLMDIGIASLSMGVLSDAATREYDVRLSASTDHLRKPGVSPSLSSTLSPPTSPQARAKRKSSLTPGTFSLYNKYPSISSVHPAGNAMASVFGSGGGSASGIRRTASAAAATKGLWTRPADAYNGGSSDEGAVITDDDEMSESSRPGSSRGDAEKKKPTPGTWTKPEVKPVTKTRQPVLGTGLFQAPSKPVAATQGTITVTKPSGLFQPKAVVTTPGAMAGLWGGTEAPERKRRWTVDEGGGRP